MAGLGVEGIGLDLEFRDRIRWGREPDASPVGHVRRAVDREFVSTLNPVGDDTGKVAVVGGPGEVKVGRVHDARREPREHVGGSVAKRELRNLLAVDRRPAHPAVGIEQRLLGGHFHGLGHAAGLERDVDAQHVADSDVVVDARELLEPLQLRGDRIAPGIQVADLIKSLGIGDHGLRDVGFGVRHGDRHAGQDPSCPIRNGADDRAPEFLRRRRDGHQEQGGGNSKDSPTGSAEEHAPSFNTTGGLRPAGPPIAVARGGPNAPLRSGGARLWRA